MLFLENEKEMFKPMKKYIPKKFWDYLRQLPCRYALSFPTIEMAKDFMGLFNVYG